MKKLMTHIVTGNPDMAAAKRMVREMIDRDIAAIELQIPFSDPIADGPVLMAANDQAVKNGVSVDEAFELIKKGPTKFYLMSYLQPILYYGPEAFFARALEAGCAGFIIPDLPFDAPEIRAFIADRPELRQSLVPVLSPGMTGERLSALFGTLEPRLVYLTARHGITGERTEFTNGLEETVKRLRTHTRAELAIGFGIQTPADVRAVLGQADLAIVGSALTSALNQSEQQASSLLDKLGKVA